MTVTIQPISPTRRRKLFVSPGSFWAVHEELRTLRAGGQAWCIASIEPVRVAPWPSEASA